MDNSEYSNTWIVGQTSENTELRATPVHLGRYHAVFELYGSTSLPKASEVLDPFKILVGDETIYAGRAVVKNLVDTGPATLCEVTLEDSWIDVNVYRVGKDREKVREGYRRFLQTWQKCYKVLPEYKVLAADMQTFLTDLRLWVEQIELGIRSSPSGDRGEIEREISLELAQSAFPALDTLFEKFESLAATIDTDLKAVHRTYIRRQLHPLILCSPFAFRTINKPLGYAGDYEVVNMILRDPHEGGSLFGKLLNRWFIKQPPAEAHRNRVKYLAETLIKETARVAARQRVARVFNLGCGPAKEVQSFLAENQLCEQAHLTLLDFSGETLNYARQSLESVRRTHGRRTTLEFVRKSVAHVLKAKDRRSEGPASVKYDFIYCAGLFDYLADPICRQLMALLYDMLAPGGLLLTTNVDSCNPIQYWLSDILDWHLIYRNGQKFRSFAPKLADPDWVRLHADETGVNIFLEVRRPL
jgi:extracellular factor (EF) 3-hydroxypalmitic acid methyl ester biosynthesis protein